LNPIKLIDSLELRIAPRDGDFEESERVIFSWEVISFDSETLALQLIIDSPEIVSEGGQIDALYITFFGTSLFKAKDTGIPVRYGTILS
jgi:hypothetical protein